jgi:glyoxylase-like metal-dependent hydrolase (beta-lactamase superfamily II)
MKICEDVYKIPGHSNVYLILKPTPTIIDTSNRTNSQNVKSGIEKISLDKIEIVLLTHLHYDHVENVGLFKNAKFYADEEEIKNYQTSPKDFFIRDISSKVDNILKTKLIYLPKKIAELEVIKVPGHTRGSVAFLDKKRKLLFSGDTIFAKGIGRTDLNNSLPNKMRDSIKKLVDKIKKSKLILCPGHDF